MKFEDALKAMREGKKVTFGNKAVIYSFPRANGINISDQLMVQFPGSEDIYKMPQFVYEIDAALLIIESWEILE